VALKCLLLQYLLQRCLPWGGETMEDMCYEWTTSLVCPSFQVRVCVYYCSTYYLRRVCVCLLLQDLIQSCLRGGGGLLEDTCYERRRAEACVN
jgi:hypothetical protein